MLEKLALARFTEYKPLPVPEEENKSKLNTNNNLLSESEDDLLYIYPNPVNDILAVEYAMLNTAVNSLGRKL